MDRDITLGFLADYPTPAQAGRVGAARMEAFCSRHGYSGRVPADQHMIAPFHGFRDLICTIPGISTRTADVIIAETGADMTRFPTAGQLASWAGTTPGNNESAGKVKSTRTRPGNPYLQGALGAAAMSCAQNPSTYLGARYRRIASRRGPQKANVAFQHSMLIAIWHMGTNGCHPPPRTNRQRP